MSSTTSWYGKSPAKQLEQLLQTRPRISQLLATPEFIQQLKSYNPKLLQYLTNNPSIIIEAIELITIPPLESDSHERKYKLPLQVIEMIETETTCILNTFFKETQKSTANKKEVFLDLIFNQLMKTKDQLYNAGLLPLLAGYFFRTCVCLLNNRYKELLQFVYFRPYIFPTLIQHSSSMPICNTIQLFINLDVNKSSENDSAKLEIKKEAMKKILQRIETERKMRRESSAVVIENLMTVLIETIQKYYLIQDGKSLVELLTSQQTITTMLELTKQPTELSYPAFSFFISLINYYSFSSFNADEVDEEKKLKNLSRLESQPMVVALRQYFSTALSKIMKAEKFTLYEYKLLQMLCHCISISSQNLLQSIKQTQFFANLITLLFKHPNNNILHMLIEKSFLHVFISQRKIYEKYKKHLFCEIDIIDLTAGRVLRQNEEGNVFEKMRKKGGFGHFMRILKIYSGIQTTEESIITAIKAKTETWNKIASCLIKPYETICFKQLGTYENLPEGKFQQFEVTKSNPSTTDFARPNIKPLTNSMIEEIRKEDEILPVKKEQQKGGRVLSQMVKEQSMAEKKKQEELLKSPTHNFTIEFKNSLKVHANNNKDSVIENDNLPQPPKQIKKADSFKQFMSKKKVQAQKQIRLKRSLSHQKRLSGSKGKMLALSPKKNSWTEKMEQEGDKDSEGSKITKNSQLPKIPHYVQNTSASTTSISNPSKQQLSFSQASSNTVFTSKSIPPYRSYYGSSIHSKFSPSTERQKPLEQQDSNITKQQSQMIVHEKNNEILKKIKVIRIQAPKQKKYRKLEQKDKVLLEFLGIQTQ